MNGNVIGAEFSPCRKHRYVLWRIWDRSLPMVMFIGLNPSIAHEIKDDPTIRRVKDFAKRWGYGGLYMANLFSFVTPKPVELHACPDPVERNDEWLLKVAALCSDVVFAWGNHKMARERAKEIMILFPNAKALKLNKNGSPMHPLFVAGNTKLILFPQTEAYFTGNKIFEHEQPK